ncbi:radical SAM protein [Caldilinea sp.]|jgi:putative pyruvate formate lyase activating enzyme|uniref:radical SAM protein n=1 Tax=Caldilinea sp. TaxID=2293560 RepID=UPI0021DEDC5A|nr:radical SAM protein [Caldilinea sp.]GIV75519.1 MAG: radical SAM protein [Caldilinea sp.]
MNTSARAAAHLTDCHLCPFRCGVLRSAGDGVCRVGATSYVASEMLHWGEEEPLRPAHAIFFSGCTARCSFCIAARFAFRPTYGVPVSAKMLAQRILQRQAQGARSVCFIGGDPAPHIPLIVEVLSLLGERCTIPTVFNSNFYLTDEALDLLDGWIDIYLPDLKFGPASGPQSCGEALGGMPDYWRVVTHCIDRTLARGARVIVRHLLMPGHFDCCTAPALAWLAERPGLEVSLLTQYLPPSHLQGALANSLGLREIEQARAVASRLGLRLVK